ncbi:MAG: TetR/AcrR family transcriptional regulator [Deltaproteobacteria bacterium]|nr:TetR/AcrR family transcriptional regulator [Deltaproteobacteria bacterium]
MATPANGRGRRIEPGKGGILLTAIDCFTRHGYAGTSIDRIARAAGVTKGALYYHFRDKEQLLFEAVKERIGAFESYVLGKVEPIADPAKSLRAIARICAENAATDNHRRFILTLMVEALDTNVTLSGEFREMLRRFRSFHRHLIRSGQESGLFRNDVDASAAAETFVGGILGAEVQFYQDPEAIDVRSSLETHVDQFLAWLTMPPDAQRRATQSAREV